MENFEQGKQRLLGYLTRQWPELYKENKEKIDQYFTYEKYEFYWPLIKLQTGGNPNEILATALSYINVEVNEKQKTDLLVYVNFFNKV